MAQQQEKGDVRETSKEVSAVVQGRAGGAQALEY